MLRSLSFALALPFALTTVVAPRAAHAQPATELRSTAARPFSLMIEGGLGGPTGLLGASFGYHPSAEVELVAGFGIGFTGYQAALGARYALPLAGSPTMSWLFGAGPSLAFRSGALGMHIEHAADVSVARDDLFYTAWLNLETGWEGRASWGGTLRITIGLELRVADNQAHLCDGATEGDASDGCNPIDFAPGSTFAAHPLLPFLSFAYGWAF